MQSRPLSRPAALPVLMLLSWTTPSAHGQTEQNGGNSAKKPKRLNAHMTVTYYTYGKYLDSWSRPVVWTGRLNEYSGYVDGQQIQWIGEPPNPDSIRLMTTRTGEGGDLLRVILPPNTTGVTVVVTSLANANGRSKAPRAESRAPTPRATRSKRPRQFRPQTSYRRQRVPRIATDRPRSTKRTTATVTRRPRKDKRPATIARAPSVRDKRQIDKPATLGDGSDKSQRARDAHLAGRGVLKGRTGGQDDGEAGGATREEGGIQSPNATARGDGITAHGMKGGTGPNSAQGIASGGGLIGLINVPASLRTLTSALLTLKDANPTQLSTKWMSRITKTTTARSLRKRLKREAGTYAANRMKSNAGAIAKAIKDMPEQEAAKYVRRVQWEIERRYFDNAAKGAAKKARKLTKKSKQLADADAEELRRALLLQEAADAKPLAGQLPRNHSYAGKEFPRDRLPAPYRDIGVRVKRNGHPDFEPHAMVLPNGKRSVKIQLTGNTRRDSRLASEAAGFTTGKPPKEFTWHHVEDGTTMQLIPTDLHDAVRHSGGQAAHRHRTGDLNAYPRR